MGAEESSHGEYGIDELGAGPRDAPGVGAVAAERIAATAFGEQRGIPLSTLRWWRRVFRAAGAAAPAVAFTEVPAPVSVPRPFQLPTSCAIPNPNWISVKRDSPRHMTMLPGGGSLARAR